MESEADAGTYNKRIEVTYNTNGYTITDHLDYSYTVKPAAVIVSVDNVEREYGHDNPEFDIVLTGMAEGEDASMLQTEPTATCKATKASDVGTYDNTLNGAKGKNYTFTYEKGTLTVTKAPLTIYTSDVTITEGEAIPPFTILYDGFRNNDNENVLTKKPVATTTATSDSPAGTYPITIDGAEAKNYEPVYEEAVLTIRVNTKVQTVTANGSQEQQKLFNLQGQAVENPRKGLYISKGKKIVVRK